MTLLQKLQNTTKGDWVLNSEIAEFLGWKIDQYDVKGRALFLVPGESSTRYLPDWTRNLQDAVSLVPEGTWYWHIRKHSSSGRRHDAIVTLRKPGETADRCQFQADHRTPALALCIAIVKSVEHERQTTQAGQGV